MPPEFADFDTRQYPMVPTRDGYAEWAATYESAVLDEMDQRLLDRMDAVTWADINRAVDLGCGTGRNGVWLNRAGVRQIDGIDLTPEMLRIAESKGIYESLRAADIAESGLDDAAYDLAVVSLVDEHVADLAPLYRESARLIRLGGSMIIIGYHPQFIMASGMPTHFHRDGGDAIAITTHIHLLSDHVRAATSAGLSLVAMDESIVDESWIAKKPKWQRYRGQPISFLFCWRKAN